jgi:NAD(P)-dependent dehydrogenase (short-subunit alcohol dehydrogenase family)
MLSDKVCIVAGAGTGLGEAAAVELGRQGATVVVNDLGVDVTGEGESEEPAEETIKDVKEAGGDGMAHFGDISSFDYTESLIQDTVDEYGRVDGVVNFAGILRDGISYKMTEEEWDQVINVHLRGHFALLRNVAAHWREEIGDDDDATQRSILNVSSRAALGSIGQSNYSAAKAGILGLTRATARELYRYNIRVNALMPTAFTRMIEAIPEEKRSFTEEEMPPEKVAAMVAYVMSDEAEDITGCTLRAAGDEIGLITNPELHRLGYSEGGWTPQKIAEQFQDSIASGIDLTRTEREW